MDRIAEILFQAYENSTKLVVSENFEEKMKNLTQVLKKDQYQQFLDFELEIYETLQKHSIDLIIYLLKLIIPDECFN